MAQQGFNVNFQTKKVKFKIKHMAAHEETKVLIKISDLNFQTNLNMNIAKFYQEFFKRI